MPFTTARDRVGSRGSRREELIGAALGLVRHGSVDALDAAALSRAAGVSKALIYYYFPTHRDLHVAVARAAADGFLAAVAYVDTAADDSLLGAGLEKGIAFIERDPATYQALTRSAGFNPEMQEVFDCARNGVVAFLAAALGVPEPSPALLICLRSWLALVEEAVLHWILAGRPIPRAALVAYCEEMAGHVLATPLATSYGSLSLSQPAYR